LIAGRDVLLGTIIELKGWRERAEMFRAIIPLQRFGNGVRTGCDAIVAILGEGIQTQGYSGKDTSMGGAVQRGETVSS
jgi:hypothetical protein